MTRDDLDTLREGWDFEAKLAVGPDGRGAVPDSFWETYSARANSQGGRIDRAWQEDAWPAPRIVENVELDTTTFILDMGDASSDTSSATSSFEGSANAQAILHAGRERFLTVREISGVISRNPVTVRQEIPRLVAEGRLERDRPGRGWKYRLPSSKQCIEHTAVESKQTQVESEQTRVESPQTGESSPQTSPQSGESSPQSAADSPQSHPAASLPIGVIARVPSTRWALKADIRAAIVAACRERFVTLHELASLLNRSPRTLQQHYVRHLVAQGTLVLRHPEQPNHPDQAYRAPDESEPEGNP